MLGATVQSGLGVSEQSVGGRFVVRGGSYSAGHVLCLDLERTYADNALVGSPSSCWAILRGVTARAQLGVGVLAVLEENAAEFAKARAKVAGFVQAYIRKASGDVSPGDPLVAKNGQTYLSADFAPGDRVVATYQGDSDLAAPSTAKLGLVAIEGRYGLGIDV